MEAEEAALSLLSMGHSYQATSSATLNSILTTTLPTIPQKRKHTDSESPFHTPQTYPVPLPTPLSPSPKPADVAKEQEPTAHDTSTEAVDCICGFSVDDGFSIACDICSKWCHSACFGIAQGAVPEKFLCWSCKPRSLAEKERAVRLQKERLRLVDAATTGGGRRRSSPGLERKGRRGTTAGTTAPAAIEASTSGTGKKRRRPSIVQPPPTTPNIATPTINGEDEHVDIDNEPWKEAYVHIVEDIIPSDDTRAKLRQQAINWRGVTALGSEPALVPSSSLTSTPPISIKPIPPQSTLNPFLSQNLNPHVLPPSFALHTTEPIPCQTLITPFRSCVTPSSAYLSDPLNAYSHLGMPKPFVHLLGPPLDVALDARLVGNQGRFVRWGCRPNAVLRPVICDTVSGEGNSLDFGVFALRDLRADEEIVLGWEWDDGNAIHKLPALLQAPYTFPIPPFPSQPHIQQLRNQYSNILHALSSTFTTCACGARARDCALTQMAAFVDGRDLGVSLSRRPPRTPIDPNETDDEVVVDMGPLVGRKRGFRTRERVPGSGGIGGMEMLADETTSSAGPSSSKPKGRGVVYVGQERSMPPPLPSFVMTPSSPTPSFARSTRKGKERAVEGNTDVEMEDGTHRPFPPSLSTSALSLSSSHLSSPPLSSLAQQDRIYPRFEPRPPDPPDGGGQDAPNAEDEARMPPKMRKRWMHRTLEARMLDKDTEKDAITEGEKSTKIGLGILLDDEHEQRLMPPPPMPAALDPTTISSNSGSPNPSFHPQVQRPTTSSPTTPTLPSSPHELAEPRVPSPRVSPAPQPSLVSDVDQPHTVIHEPQLLPSPSLPPNKATSPLIGFETLSLMSPALNAEQHQSTTLPSITPLAAPISEDNSAESTLPAAKRARVEVEDVSEAPNSPLPTESPLDNPSDGGGDISTKEVEEVEAEASKDDIVMEGLHAQVESRHVDVDGDVEMIHAQEVNGTIEPSRSVTPPPAIHARSPTPLTPSPSLPSSSLPSLSIPTQSTPSPDVEAKSPRTTKLESPIPVPAPPRSPDSVVSYGGSSPTPHVSDVEEHHDSPTISNHVEAISATSSRSTSPGAITKNGENIRINISPERLAEAMKWAASLLPAVPRQASSISSTEMPSPLVISSVPLPIASSALSAESPAPLTPELPPQKVKMSLKDFALRKKKQRELEQKEKAEEVKVKEEERQEPSKKPLKQILEELKVGPVGGIPVSANVNGTGDHASSPAGGDVHEKENRSLVGGKEFGLDGRKADGVGVDKASGQKAVDDVITLAATTDTVEEILPSNTALSRSRTAVASSVPSSGQLSAHYPSLEDVEKPAYSRSSPLPSKPVTTPAPPSRSIAVNGDAPISAMVQPIKQVLPPRPPTTWTPPGRPFRAFGKDLHEDQPTSTSATPSLLERMAHVEHLASPASSDPTGLANRVASSTPHRQEEDGEINEEASPPPTMDQRVGNPASFPSSGVHHSQIHSRSGLPFGSVPPTGPRALTRPPSHRPTIPSTTPSASTANGAKPPTGPRALRMLKSTPAQPQAPSLSPTTPSTSPTVFPSKSSNSSVAPVANLGRQSQESPYIPRGPSADRDSSRDQMDWEHRSYRGLHPPSQPPRRNGGYGWNR